MVENIVIHTEWIKLDQLLKLAGKVQTGGQAKEAVLSGQVSFNGEICLMRGRKVRPGDRVVFGGDELAVTAPAGGAE